MVCVEREDFTAFALGGTCGAGLRGVSLKQLRVSKMKLQVCVETMAGGDRRTKHVFVCKCLGSG